MKPTASPLSRPDARAGFSLIEMLAALAIAGAMIAVVSEFAGRAMQNWNRGEQSIAVMEMVTRGIGRLSTDLSKVLPMSVPETEGTIVFFTGEPNRMQFIAVTGLGAGNNGVEMLDIAALSDGNETLLVRRRGPAVIPAAQLRDPVTLLRGRLRVQFSFADRDGKRTTTWRDKNELPSAVVVELRDAQGRDVFATPFVLPLVTNSSVECAIPSDEGAARPLWCGVAEGAGQTEPRRNPLIQPPTIAQPPAGGTRP